MMIGGWDTIYETDKPEELANAIMAFVNWPHAVIERDEDRDFFYYVNEAAKQGWHELGAVDELANTMVYFLISDFQLTVVTDEELTAKIRKEFGV